MCIGGGSNGYGGEYPEMGQGQLNFSIPNPDSLMGIPGQVLGDISLSGESVLSFFRSVFKMPAEALASLRLEPATLSPTPSPTCFGEGEETESCGMTSCPT